MDKTMDAVDSKALFTCFIKKLPVLLVMAVAGALIGSGLAFISALSALTTPVYVSETKYYIDFAEGRLEARDFYNAFTWNEVLTADWILGEAMEALDGYEREAVRDMITAEMPSDIRYLTILIRGTDAAAVGQIQTALQMAVESFGDKVEEIDSVTMIEKLEITQEKAALFTRQAAVLGAFVLTCIGIFVIAFRFLLGDCIYTKTDITKYFGLPAYGLLFAGENQKDGRQERMLVSGVKKLLAQRTKLVLADCARQGDAVAFAQKLEKLKDADIEGHIQILNNIEGNDRILNTAAEEARELIVVIPFGVPCRQRVMDEINYLRLQGYEIVGAVLAEVDRRWMNIYLNTR